MILKLKSFIYRFSNIFGLRIYLARKEENAYIKSLELSEDENGEFMENLSRGTWQARHGFTTVWTYEQNIFRATKAKISHAFRK
jgi:hypothetical protein